MGKLTPMMKQYLDLKEKYKDCILFFRLGDFYEMFFDDAILASKELEITLTGRDCGLKERAPMCGVPHHSAENYIAKLIDKGHKVAICEQVEDPSVSKGIVKRDVVKIITPGTVMDAYMLDEKENNYIMSIYVDDDGAGISFADVSTGELRTTEFTKDNFINCLLDEIVKINPKEIIINTLQCLGYDLKSEIYTVLSKPYIDVFDSWAFKQDYAIKKIKQHFNIIAIEGFGIDDKNHSTCSIGALFEYLQKTQKNSLSHINNIYFYSSDAYMILDKSTRRNLELTETMREKKRKGSLLWILDKTNTAMGGRILKKWIEEPLKDIGEIQSRLDAVEELKENILAREELKELLNNVYDLERLVVRISYGNANARDLIALKGSLEVLPKVKKILDSFNTLKLKNVLYEINLVQEVKELIKQSIMDDPPITIKEGGIIKRFYNHELDELREIISNSKQWIANLENNERLKTGIKSLKIGFNKVFGYYLEVTKTNLNLVPENYIRKQTLANAERYITPELKEAESKILGAEDKVVELEYQIFVQIRDEIKKFTKEIQNTARAIATLDALISFAEVSDRFGYTKPKINNDLLIDICNGRHPVVERTMDFDMFIGNDTLLDGDENRFSIITGPNMAGKSTYMRQVALIVLMAQIGCFVPADKATIGVVDRIFTRVGASDDLARGQSTFMVEMSELANILNNATKKSLIILDEIGRGTSTYDGLSIAWAVVEYISSKKVLGARTLFATHYHELTELEGILNGVKNYCISVEECNDDIIFLRKIIRGSADQSYGIQVAKLAGVIDDVITRAKQILLQLEENDINKKNLKEDTTINKTNEVIYEKQMSIFDGKNNDVIEELKKIDILDITPMEAMNHLYKLVKLAQNRGV
ncbi:DNA mismatch repair protein MutS [Crassaminicella thermophila]|uniref:DNA mismatch repair protein MutS n=1 Tax=Crassaminicella thermophila TaxID=2599308 RepID=A0A5C0SEG8_CRATE|nr:DNA mismatch repair protein MutS [Crassaminicella thermophila]QEK12176.1 DNA mismatch repair protein MutS [Crassaminicella thermophila]